MSSSANGDAEGQAVAERSAQRDRALLHAALSGAGGRAVTIIAAVFAVSAATRALTTVEFGVVATLGTITGLLGFADLGIGNGLMSQIAAAHGRDDVKTMRGLVSSAWLVLVGLGALISIAGLFAAFLLPWQEILGAEGLDETALSASAAVFFVSLGLSVPAGVGQRILLALQQGSAANAWTAISAAMILAAVLVCAWVEAPLWAFVAATVSTPVLVSGAESLWVLGRRHRYLWPRRRWSTQADARQLLRISGLFFVLGAAVSVAYQSDSIIVAWVMGAAEAAVFVVAMRLFQLLSSTVSTALQQIWPALTEAMSRDDNEWIRSRFRYVMRLVVVVGGTGCIVLVVFGQPVIRIWAGDALVPPMNLLVLMGVWTFYGMVMTQCSFLMNAAQVVRPQVLMAVSMAAVNIVLSIYLTREYGLIGPVVGSLAAHMFCAGVPTLVIVRRLLAGRAPTMAQA
ncbi:MAG: oligosaccharide flippase family protein [Candidatus Nanopelagicales bacterium]